MTGKNEAIIEQQWSIQKADTNLEKLQVVHAMLLLVLMCLPALIAPLGQWPMKALFPVAAYALFVACVPSLRKSVLWLKVGRLDRITLLCSLLLVVASTGALVGWYFAAHPDLSAFYGRFPSQGLLLLPLVGLLFAVVNATLEEVVWRGVLFDALTAGLGGKAALVMQAIGFGAGHYAGVPGGLAGVVLATGYGFALGLLRRRASGLLACILAHIGADAVIYFLIFHSR